MADNVGYTPGAGALVAADDIDGVLYQRIKPTFGSDGAATDVSTNDPMPIAAYGELIEALEAQRMALQALTRTIGQAMPDVAGRLRVAIDAISASLTLATITTVGTVTTVSTVTNQSQMGTIAANDQIPSLMKMSAGVLRNNISVT
jgi:hypothetical protein